MLIIAEIMIGVGLFIILNAINKKRIENKNMLQNITVQNEKNIRECRAI